MAVHIFTDGSTINNGKPNARGGIGIFINELNIRHSISYLIETPTNQRCELYAILKALEIYLNLYLENGGDKNVIIYSDSMYSINSATKWLPNWKKLGWKTSSKGEIKNLWLIQQIDFLQEMYKKANITINYKFVRAHKMEPKDKKSEEYFEWKGNDIVDKLAKKGADNIKKM